MSKHLFQYALDKGKKRPNNEDQAAYLNKKKFKLVLVADGMGGHASGEIASSMAKDMIVKLFDLEEDFSNVKQAKSTIKKIMKKTNSMIHKLASEKKELYGMGTTVCFALVLEDKTIIVNCGDSRLYELRDDKLNLLTTDQTVVQYLYEIGVMSKQETLTSPKRHVLMNAMGISPSIDYDLRVIDNNYDALIACTDGLTNMLDDTKIEGIIKKHFYDVDKACEELVIKALDEGGIDNIGVCLMEVDKRC